jgi:hypothetical protein
MCQKSGSNIVGSEFYLELVDRYLIKIEVSRMES